MKKIFMRIKDNSGSAIVLTMGFLLAALLLCTPVYVFAQVNTQISKVTEISQNSLDVYTIKMGKAVMKSVKNGNDYTELLDQSMFVRDLTKQLDFRTGLTATDSKGNLILDISNVKAKFILDKSLKTTVKYDIKYQYYFLSRPLFTDTFTVTQESRYNLKF